MNSQWMPGVAALMGLALAGSASVEASGHLRRGGRGRDSRYETLRRAGSGSTKGLRRRACAGVATTARMAIATTSRATGSTGTATTGTGRPTVRATSYVRSYRRGFELGYRDGYEPYRRALLAAARVRPREHLRDPADR